MHTRVLKQPHRSIDNVFLNYFEVDKLAGLHTTPSYIAKERRPLAIAYLL